MRARVHPVVCIPFCLIFAACPGSTDPIPAKDKGAVADLADDLQAAGDASDLSIQSFIPPEITLAVGQSFDLNVRLSKPPTQETYVDVVNSYQQQVSVDPVSLKFPVGDFQVPITVTGLASTGGELVPLTFTIRPSGPSRDFKVKIE
jgi:hypothetical protein